MKLNFAESTRVGSVYITQAQQMTYMKQKGFKFMGHGDSTRAADYAFKLKFMDYGELI
jgi:hypothetical protein